MSFSDKERGRMQRKVRRSNNPFEEKKDIDYYENNIKPFFDEDEYFEDDEAR